ncbi:MAG: SCO1664 family protein [Actinomycetota bacterium]|nr:SCO1664 family protein [Actinomycetota bacterium]
MSIPDELTQPVELEVEDAIDLLCHGELTVEGRLMDASNATLYCAITASGVTAACVYKPVAGERPLWDFPDGSLAQREVAAYEVSAAIGWDIVPPTIYRDGPAGPGMVQLWIAEDDATDLMPLIRRRDVAALRRIAVYDAVINNADRKGGHLLPIPSGHVYGVDHGVSFHVEDKLRTVLWQWAGARLTEEALDTLSGLRAQLEGQLCARLGELLTRREVRATVRRVEDLLSGGRHPRPGEDWPAVPWPPI